MGLIDVDAEGFDPDFDGTSHISESSEDGVLVDLRYAPDTQKMRKM